MPRVYRKKLVGKKTTGLTKKARVEVKAIAKRVVHTAEPLHFIDEYSTGTEIINTATFINLTDSIAKGDLQTSRTGQSVNLKSLRFHGTVSRDSGTADSYDFDHIRMILFKWMPSSDDEAPTAAGILYDSANDPFNSPHELDFAKTKKFRIIEDRRILLGARYAASNPVDSGLPIVRNLSFRKYAKHLGRVDYEAGSETLASGHIYLMLLGTRTAGVNASTMSYHATFKFEA